MFRQPTKQEKCQRLYITRCNICKLKETKKKKKNLEFGGKLKYLTYREEENNILLLFISALDQTLSKVLVREMN